ncbi:MAG: TrpB-like pyridoxal phosphate-dependent enzyme [Isosphaeraceae bacterium]
MSDLNAPSSGRVVKFNLPEDAIPDAWYNVLADLPFALPPPVHPATGRPVGPEDLAPLFPLALIDQEMTAERWVPIPAPVRDAYRLWRPTPLKRAHRFERALGTRCRIYFKDESTSPVGSHKINTALAQAYYNQQAGIQRLTTETGAGQWGTALSFACKTFGLDCRVYMVKVSYGQKPFRRTLMRIWGADVFASPTDRTEAGRRILEADPECPGSLGIAISEAVEEAAADPTCNYALGSVLNHVLLHQSVIGLEARQQLALAGETPDYLLGCVGGGSNFGGLVLPFIPDRIAHPGLAIIGVEPTACPTMTRGPYAYDFGDTAALTPLLKMHTLGHGFMPPGIHAGGLRYHGCAPLISALIDRGLIVARAVPQTRVFEAAVLFAQTEGIVPAPETAHAIAAVADVARAEPDSKCIVFNLSGHGFLDLAAYEKFLNGELVDYDYPSQAIEAALRDLPVTATSDGP